MSFQATARLAVERETYSEGRPASFHMWESMARHMIESLDCDGAFAKRIDAERMARMLTGALLGLHLTWQATGHEQGLHEEVEYFWRTIAPVLIAPSEYEALELSRPAWALDVGNWPDERAGFP